MEAIAQEKVTLRRTMQARIAQQSTGDARGKSAAIWERLSVLSEFASAKCLLVYVSRESEVDTHGLIRQLLAMGRQVCVPAFEPGRGQYIASAMYDFDADLTAGKYGILEPSSGVIRPVAPEHLDAAVSPGLAFDETGNRLGRGKGYFDRLLREVHGAKIALAFDFQLLTEVPAEAHDARVDFVVTETRVVKTKR